MCLLFCVTILALFFAFLQLSFRLSLDIRVISAAFLKHVLTMSVTFSVLGFNILYSRAQPTIPDAVLLPKGFWKSPVRSFKWVDGFLSNAVVEFCETAPGKENKPNNTTENLYLVSILIHVSVLSSSANFYKFIKANSCLGFHCFNSRIV